jgi:hypothetical protein
MTICNKAILFFILVFVTASSAQRLSKKDLAVILSQKIEECQANISADSIIFFASKETSLARLKKEYDSLDQDFFEKCDSKDIDLKYCNRMLAELNDKKEECKNLVEGSYWRRCYDSQDIEVEVKILIDRCTKLKYFYIRDKKNGNSYNSTFYPHNEHSNTSEKSVKSFGSTLTEQKIGKLCDGDMY